MGDDLGDEWWKHDDGSDVEEDEEVKEEEKLPSEKSSSKTKPGKRKNITEKEANAKKKKKSEQLGHPEDVQQKETEDEKPSKPKRKRKKKKKTITDVLASSEPKPGRPADLQNLLTQFFSDKRSVIEQEELKLEDSCFLSCNDLTHSLSSYLKHICPKWAKIRKQHTDRSSVIVLIVCSSALRAIELIKQMTTFKGDARAVKLFAKHIKIEEQVTLLQNNVTHIGVGTPGRISALIEKEGLTLGSLKYIVLDWNWRDQKLRRMVDIPEIKLDLMKLLDAGLLQGCRGGQVKIGLF
ncbi:protein CMSS1 [Cynoglossus semilaevis]|uniref:Cms1 ribosomal small subunit homolog n=1 Tax=Cynoglossus semilaevis TaxID=244447 RepID=A0A3P8UWW6_CYNSE|nr:protein CMSS1 [Cynoglossus semilaevis]XP_024919462.1 protein CMSS1 [Cynoglossus semilaevis]